MQRVAAVALASLIAGVAGGTGLAAAQPPQSAPMGEPPVSLMEASPVLKAIDANHDHIISAAELANAPAALLTLDKNGDGKLTRDEAGMSMAAFRRPGGDRAGEPPQTPAPGPTADDLLSMLMSFDKNHDGKLQRAEVPDRQAGLFERGDTNKDGVLDEAELRKLTADQAAAPVAPPRAGGGRPRGFPPFDPAAALDKDGNGEISADEIAGAAAALEALDKNGDGQITEEELRPSGEGRGAQE
jgi:Ca2+-binding EF-hand superfamily protein